ncbi:MAG: hypothetical protein H6R18_640 [Proteobacteria bacterium]|nr:hypothetical protein [Pseudomonadota bacterium]
MSVRSRLSIYARLMTFSCFAGLLTPLANAFLADSAGRIAWIIDLTSHWQWLFVIGLVIGSGIAACKQKRWALALLALPLPWLTVSPLAPAASQADKAFLVASANVHFGNQDPAPLIQWLAKTQPDIVVLIEISPEYAAALKKLPGYPHRHLAPQPDPFGIALLSRHPLRQIAALRNADGIPRIEAEIDWQGKSINIIGYHPMPPITPQHHATRNQELQSFAIRASQSKQPMIVAGDLNASPWSSAFHSLDKLGLWRASGLRPTWPAIGQGIIGIPIDHALVSAHWSVLESGLGPNLGSDHRPLLVKISPSGSRKQP